MLGGSIQDDDFDAGRRFGDELFGPLHTAPPFSGQISTTESEWFCREGTGSRSSKCLQMHQGMTAGFQTSASKNPL